MFSFSNLNINTLLILDKSRKHKTMLYALVFLTFIALVVWVQNYFKYGYNNDYTAQLSLLYNLSIYSSFTLLTPLVFFIANKLPFDQEKKLQSIVIQFFIGAIVCLSHMMLCNVILFWMDLVSAIPFPRFMWKYLTGVIHVHFLIYWAIYGMVSISKRIEIKKISTKNHVRKGRFKVSMNKEQYFVAHEDVYWIEALDHYQKLHTEKGCHIIKDTMTSLENRLPASLFCRVHRSYFVNVNKIHSVHKDNGRDYFVKLNNDASLKISDSYKSQLLSVINS